MHLFAERTDAGHMEGEGAAAVVRSLFVAFGRSTSDAAGPGMHLGEEVVEEAQTVPEEGVEGVEDTVIVAAPDPLPLSVPLPVPVPARRSLLNVVLSQTYRLYSSWRAAAVPPPPLVSCPPPPTPVQPSSDDVAPEADATLESLAPACWSASFIMPIPRTKPVVAEVAGDAPEPFSFPRRRGGGLEFSLVQMAESMDLRLNSDASMFLPLSTDMLYLVLHDGGWCVLDSRQATYLNTVRMSAVGLGDVQILQVQVLPMSCAVEGLFRAILDPSEDPSETDFIKASLRVRTALHAGGLGKIVEVSSRVNIDLHGFRHACSEAPRREVLDPPNRLLIESVSEFLFATTEFSYGASVITVSQLYDRMIRRDTCRLKMFMATELTFVFRRILHYLCLEVQKGCIRHLRWRAKSQRVEGKVPDLLTPDDASSRPCSKGGVYDAGPWNTNPWDMCPWDFKAWHGFE